MFAPVVSLAQLLEPYPEDDFIRHHWQKTFKHVKGAAGRFENLLPWSVLNDILAQHRLDEPRLRIVKEGKAVTNPAFISYPRLRNLPFEKVPRLNAEALSAHLRDGATLILDHVDEFYEPLTTLARNLERTFKVGLQVNAYAGWRTSRGFDLHWDGHEVMVLQVSGRKSWQVYGATRRHPLTRDIEPNSEIPKTSLWEGVLESGDVLYIPRGMWHVALPMDEPTLHLTFGFTTSSGEELFEWMARRLRASEVVRQDLPKLAGKDARRRHAAALRDAFDAAWHADILDDYFRYVDQNAPARPSFSLPFAAMEKPFAGDASAILVEWRTARNCTLAADNEGTLWLKAHGREWEFEAAAGPLLDLLMRGGQHAVSELCRTFADSISEEQIVAFLEALLHDGLLVAR